MFRVLLTAYVTLVMLAGPSACCCTTAHVFADCFGGDDPGGEGRPTCCCGHEAAAGGSETRESSAGDGHGCPNAPGDEHECPCRANKSPVVAEARKQVAELQQFRSLDPAPFDLPAVGTAEVDAAALCPDAQVRNRASHFGSAREILRALQTYLI